MPGMQAVALGPLGVGEERRDELATSTRCFLLGFLNATDAPVSMRSNSGDRWFM